MHQVLLNMKCPVGLLKMNKIGTILNQNAIDNKNEEMLRAEILKYSKLRDWEGDEYSKKTI